MLGSWLRLNIILLFRRRLIIIIRGLGLSLMLLDLGFVFFVVKILYRGGGAYIQSLIGFGMIKNINC